MRIRDDSNQYNSLYHLALSWARLNSTDYTFEEFVRDANLSLNEVSAVIMEFDNTWQWQDFNLVDGDDNPVMNIAYSDLEAGQDNYPLSISHLKISRIRIKDRNGNYTTLRPKDRRQQSDTLLNATGDPREYDKFGNLIFLLPTPNYSYERGIEMQYQGLPVYFTPDDTTKEPGYNPQFHELVALISAKKKCKKEGFIDQANIIESEIGLPPRGSQEGTGMYGRMVNYYSSRDYDRPQNFHPANSNDYLIQ